MFFQEVLLPTPHCPTLSSQQFCVCFEAASALTVNWQSASELQLSGDSQNALYRDPPPTPAVADAGQATVHRVSLCLKARGPPSCLELHHIDEGRFHEVQNHITH